VAQVADFSQINTEHINTVWAESTVVECKTGGASRDQRALECLSACFGISFIGKLQFIPSNIFSGRSVCFLSARFIAF